MSDHLHVETYKAFAYNVIECAKEAPNTTSYAPFSSTLLFIYLFFIAIENTT